MPPAPPAAVPESPELLIDAPPVRATPAMVVLLEVIVISPPAAPVPDPAEVMVGVDSMTVPLVAVE